MNLPKEIPDQTDMITESPLPSGFYELDDAVNEIVRRTGALFRLESVNIEISKFNS